MPGQNSLTLVLALSTVSVLAGQSSSLGEAAADFEHGRIAEAAQKLDAILKSRPDDLSALILEGAVLDSLQRYGEAEKYYERALKLAPDSAQVLSNAGTHYLASGASTRVAVCHPDVGTVSGITSIGDGSSNTRQPILPPVRRSSLTQTNGIPFKPMT